MEVRAGHEEDLKESVAFESTLGKVVKIWAQIQEKVEMLEWKEESKVRER